MKMTDSRRVIETVLRTVETIVKTSHGTIVTHPVLMNHLEVSNMPQYYNRMRIVREILKIEHGIFLETISKRGYQIAKRGDEYKLCEGEILKGLRRTQKGIGDFENIRLDEITDQKKRTETIEHANKWNTLKHMSILNPPKALAGMVRLGMARHDKDSGGV